MNSPLPTSPPTAGDDNGLVAVFVEFGRALRAEGLPVGAGDLLTFCAAMTPLDPTDLVDLYWAGRTSLVSSRNDTTTYDVVFRRFFLQDANPVDEVLRLALTPVESEAVLEVPATDPERVQDPSDEETVLGLMASNVEALRNKSFAACTEPELAAVRRIMTRIRLTPPRRRTRRSRPARRGRSPDLRHIIRRSLRMQGEITELRWRRRRYRLRPLILLLDISGSMADYSRGLLQFAYSAKRAASTRFKVEVFCFGTRLTWLTPSLESRSPDDALNRAGTSVVDWEGGTRIGESLASFVRGWGRRGMCRGAVVVICSDGLDRGDPEVLAGAMERLSRLSHRIVWMNPHKGDDKHYRPQSVGMMVAAPHIDLLLSGHDLASLEELAELLPTLG